MKTFYLLWFWLVWYIFNKAILNKVENKDKSFCNTILLKFAKK